jgi:hypothetical protein
LRKNNWEKSWRRRKKKFGNLAQLVTLNFSPVVDDRISLRHEERVGEGHLEVVAQQAAEEIERAGQPVRDRVEQLLPDVGVLQLGSML